MTLLEKLNEIEEIIIRWESEFHGQDGDDCTYIRKLIIEIEEELKVLQNRKWNFSPPASYDKETKLKSICSNT